MTLLILTAFNSAYADIGTLAVQSIARYCREHPEYRFVSHMIPDDYERPASWAKIGLIRQHLNDHPFVFWLDCDALIVGKQDILQIIDKDATLNMARDTNGLNNGVTCWRRCDEAFSILNALEAGYESHKDSPWFEQSVLHEIEDTLQIHEQPKALWNAYPEEVTDGGDNTDETLVLHFPGMSVEERIEAMKKHITL